MVRLRFQLAKELHLAAHFTRGMQNLKNHPEFSGRSVISLGGEVVHFAQPNCGKKQQNKPRTAANVSRGATPKQPAHTRNRENDECSDTPATMGRAGTPCPS